MTPLEPGVPPPVSAEGQAVRPRLLSRLRSLLRSTLAVAEMDFRKLRHDPLELLTRAIQPALWLLIFGQVFARTHAIPSGNLPYLDFLAPGILRKACCLSPSSTASPSSGSATWAWYTNCWRRPRRGPRWSPARASPPGAGLVAGSVHLCAGMAAGCESQRGSRGRGGRGFHGHSWSGRLLDFFAGRRVHRQDPRALHGHRPGPDHADVLCQQRDLSHRRNARLAAGRRPRQPADLSSGRDPLPHGPGRAQHLRLGRAIGA